MPQLQPDEKEGTGLTNKLLTKLSILLAQITGGNIQTN